MPPDTLSPRTGQQIDSLHTINGQSEKSAKEWQENLLYPVVTTLIGTFLIFIITRLWKHFREGKKKVNTLISFSLDTAKAMAKNFIDNNYPPSNFDLWSQGIRFQIPIRLL